MKNSVTSCYQNFNLTWMLTIVVGVLMVTATSCSTSTGPEDSEGFTGSWSVENWSKSEIDEGTTSIEGSADSLMLSYNVDLDSSGGGVSHRTAIFEVESPASGTVTFDWEYTGFHAFFLSYGELTVRSGSASNVLVDGEKTHGSFTFMGSTSIAVTEGQPLEFEVGGRNFDSNSRLRGDVKITDFRLIQ